MESSEDENIRTQVAESIAWSLHLESQTELEIMIDYHHKGNFTLTFEEREALCQTWSAIEEKKFMRLKEKIKERKNELKEKIAKEKENNKEEEPSSED
tara:strand:+ start:978 stop:1271 length:294 start_codon:yes stop_codon:yes gene_type:complete